MGARSGGGAGGGHSWGSGKRDLGYRITFQDVNTGKTVTKLSKANNIEKAFDLARKTASHGSGLIIKYVTPQQFKVHFGDVNTGKEVTKVSKSKTWEGSFKMAKKTAGKAGSGLYVKYVSKEG